MCFSRVNVLEQEQESTLVAKNKTSQQVRTEHMTRARQTG